MNVSFLLVDYWLTVSKKFDCYINFSSFTAPSSVESIYKEGSPYKNI
jgi:hypothetical protein